MHGHWERPHWRSRWNVDTLSITPMNTPAMPETRNDALMDSTVVQWSASVRAVIFDGIPVSLPSKNRARAFAHVGVPGTTTEKCAGSPLASNIPCLSGAWRVRNAWKIHAHIKAQVRGLLATL